MLFLISLKIRKLFNINLVIILVFEVLLFSCTNCSKDTVSETVSDGFILTSPEIKQDSLLPVEYTCDGASATLPLEWSGIPEGTECFVIIMHHEASPTDIHWYWVLYNIPISEHSLAKNAVGVGTLGNNSVNGNIGYAPPCSQGPGPKKYIFTIYALSEPVNLTTPASEATRQVLLEAIKNITISSATLTVVYSRNV